MDLNQAFTTILDALDHNRAETEHPNKRNNTAMTAVTVISPQDNENLDFSPITAFRSLVDEPMMMNSCKEHAQDFSRTPPLVSLSSMKQLNLSAPRFLIGKSPSRLYNMDFILK